MPVDESNPAYARSFHLSSPSGSIFRSTAKAQTINAKSSQSDNGRRHWLKLPEDDYPNLFPEDSTRHLKVFADWAVSMGPSSFPISVAILHERIFPRRHSPPRVDTSLGVFNGPPVHSRVPKLKLLLSSGPKCLASILPPLTGIAVALPRPLHIRSGGSRRSGV